MPFLEEGAFFESTAVAFHAMKASDLKVGQSVIVFGADFLTNL